MSGIIKICGLSTAATVDAALKAGADWLGFVFHPKSPRYVTPPQAADLAHAARGRAKIVALVVDQQDDALHALAGLLRPDLIQLHGQETPERCAAIRTRFATPVMKALGVSAAADVAAVAAFAPVADHILLDAKPPKDAAYPGGHGQPFDWSILAALPKAQPVLLSGGLTPENVAGAIAALNGIGVTLAGVDVSSGVERAPGVKDAQKIQTFVAAARAALRE